MTGIRSSGRRLPLRRMRTSYTWQARSSRNRQCGSSQGRETHTSPLLGRRVSCGFSTSHIPTQGTDTGCSPSIVPPIILGRALQPYTSMADINQSSKWVVPRFLPKTVTVLTTRRLLWLDGGTGRVLHRLLDAPQMPRTPAYVSKERKTWDVRSSSLAGGAWRVDSRAVLAILTQAMGRLGQRRRRGLCSVPRPSLRERSGRGEALPDRRKLLQPAQGGARGG